MKRIGANIPISFRAEDMDLVDWLNGQANKKYLKLGSVSAVARKCFKIVRDNNLLTEVK